MKNRRIADYVKECMHGVTHTTLNPYGPGVVRIHLIPPREDSIKLNDGKHAPCIVIINGKDIIPINISWAILLNEFILQLNVMVGYGKEISSSQMKQIVNTAISGVKKVFPYTPSNRLRRDLVRIVNALCDIAYGKEPKEKIGYMNIGQYAPFMKAPHRMDLMVSSMTQNGKWHCNQKCLHCYAAGQKLAKVDELSTNQWKAIISRCRDIGIPQLTFTGGEPTLRDDLVELIRYSQWFVTRLNTNGIRLTPEFCNSLYEASLDSVQVTLYSHNPDIHNQLVGVKAHHMTVQGIQNALKAGLNLSINTPICSINKDYVETLRFAHELGVVYVSCSGLIVTGNARLSASQKTQLSSEEMYNILKEAKAFCDEHHMQLSFTSPGWVKEDLLLSLGLVPPTCGACLSNMAIAPDGSIVPCQSWLSDEPLGNILDPSWIFVSPVIFWKIIWDSDHCKYIRNQSANLEYKCPLRKKQ